MSDITRETTARTANELLFKAAMNVHQNGVFVHPRGKLVREITDYRLFLENPYNGLCTLKARKPSYKLIIAEFLMYVCGWGSQIEHADLLCQIAPQYEAYRNPNTRLFDGAYGKRVLGQLGLCKKILTDDPDSRQAVVAIHNFWDTCAACDKNSLDIPCTCLWQFRIRNKELEMTVYMRSNDVHWGTTHDVGAFTLVQRFFAAQLGLTCGGFTLFANSLHMYENVVDAVLHSYEDYHRSVWDANFRNELLPLAFEEHRPFRSSWEQDMQMVLDMAQRFYSSPSKEERDAVRAGCDAKFEKYCEDQLHPPTLLRNLWMGITGRLIVK